MPAGTAFGQLSTATCLSSPHQPWLAHGAMLCQMRAHSTRLLVIVSNPKRGWSTAIARTGQLAPAAATAHRQHFWACCLQHAPS